VGSGDGRSQRAGDFKLTLGVDLSVAYLSNDAVTAQLYLDESLTFQINTPEAARHLVYR
jgi:uncharacterized linocin/CFP29 family protein